MRIIFIYLLNPQCPNDGGLFLFFLLLTPFCFLPFCFFFFLFLIKMFNYPLVKQRCIAGCYVEEENLTKVYNVYVLFFLCAIFIVKNKINLFYFE